MTNDQFPNDQGNPKSKAPMNWSEMTFFVKRMVSFNGTTVYVFGKIPTPKMDQRLVTSSPTKKK